MHEDFVLYVDFDSTLYDTPAFARKLVDLIARQAALPADQVRSEMEAHHFHPYLGGYEYEKHILQYGLNPDEMWQLLDTITDDSTLLYPDSAEFIRTMQALNFQPRILSFGEERFQLAKIRPMLRFLASEEFPEPLDVTVVDKKKHEHIAALHPGQKGALIDDIPGQELPIGFTEIHLDRSANIDQPVKVGDKVTLSGLQQAADVLTGLV